MRERWWIGASVLAASAGAAAAQAPTPQQTVQQAFDAAKALEATGTPAQRLAAWEALERRVAKNRRSAAVVRIRKAAALLLLNRLDEGVAAVRAGLADLPATDASLAEDRATAWLTLGQIAAEALDYAGAVEAFREGEKSVPGDAMRLTAWIGLARTLPYVDRAAAAQEGARIAPRLAQMNVGKPTLARLRRYEAERLMNEGDMKGAKAVALQAVALQGGLTERTDLEDVSARGDVALAAIMAGDEALARRYMAMTGAGRSPKGEFDPAAQMVPPPCGGDDGLKPGDVAVVEFSVADDGRVVSSSPVYAAGGPNVALTFARAVRAWSWTPEQLKTLPAFYRARTRVELRCSTAFDRPGTRGFLRAALARWLADRGVEPQIGLEGSDAAVLPRLRTALAEVEKRDGSAAPAVVPVLRRLASNALVGREEAAVIAGRIGAILAATDAPALARLDPALIAWERESADNGREGAFERRLTAALSDPAYAADAEARAVLRIVLADARRRYPRQALTILQWVADDAALAESSPLHSAALVRIASLRSEAGDAAAARAAFDRSGLSADQCSLLDSPPRFIRTNAAYPMAAHEWGFEGWALLQFDISAEGRTTNPRAVVSYPPFVFSKAGVDGARGSVWSKTFRPDGSAGCGGVQQKIRFRLPD